MARTHDREDYPSDRGRRGGQREPDWLEEHGAEFYFDQRGIRHFRTPQDGERWFKAEHGDCQQCDGTGFEQYERGGHRYARRCCYLPALKDRAPSRERRGGWEQTRPMEA